MIAIESFNVSKIYKNSNKKALSDISLQIEKGRISTLLGRNGAGKTTFIRICSTQLLPTSGPEKLPLYVFVLLNCYLHQEGY